MATSGSYDFTVTRDDVIKAALRKLGAIPRGGNPSPEQINEGAEALNLIVKEWANAGAVLYTAEWAEQVFSSPSVVQGTDANDYTCIRSHTSNSNNKPITGSKWAMYWKKVGSGGAGWVTSTSYSAAGEVAPGAETVEVQLAIIRGDGKDHALDKMSWGEYLAITEKGAFGLPRKFVFDPKATPNIIVHPQPDNTSGYLIHYRRVRMIQDFDAAANNPDLPARWFRALVYDLAANLSDDYTLPLEERKYLKGVAGEYFQRALSADTAMEIGPEMVEPGEEK